MGSAGRAPFLMSHMASVSCLSLKGTAPVNACINANEAGWVEYQHTGKPFHTHLYHNHGEREDVRFFTTCATLQDLWRSPSRSVTTRSLGAPYGIRVLGDCSETKVRYLCMTRAIYEDVALAGHQYNNEVKS